MYKISNEIHRTCTLFPFPSPYIIPSQPPTTTIISITLISTTFSLSHTDFLSQTDFELLQRAKLAPEEIDMGNYVSAISCSLFNPIKMKSPKAARVIFPTGEIRQFREPVKAAELMLDCPNFFLVNSKSLNINRRFSPLSADEDLEFGHVYIMFPMRKVNSMITPADMTVFWMAANTAPKRLSGSGNDGKVLPEAAKEEEEEKKKGDNLLGNEEERPRLCVEAPEFGYRLAVCRSRKPFLDTIAEESVYCR